ncbi:hypothetical protein C7T94_00325 [Pedobacter yulinensis]|uniref:Uncharacterized protein n=1 Tax=Pedobacter yulinensis TaxID=2126353 RepID=A0A2T3HQB7_9SPHI|nr:hypothetical protein [Pedobacter yulinensis]PST84619.1 hypothetical protein C7T94_00325 [Pedobacter yulinensis]
MKKIISVCAVIALLAVAFIHSGFISPKQPAGYKSLATVNLTASNSTSDGIYAVIQNNTSGGSTTYYIPPHTPAGTVLGQLPANGDLYTVSLTSAGGAHDMWVYWEHQSHVTGLRVSGMALGCESCARITIFN